ncbi:hypothetical protein HDV02_004061 [Globomyces sp. JEL0801]|nr:hypothetical protein HDV02_004061 [Globomyces sp. JEL0801]
MLFDIRIIMSLKRGADNTELLQTPKRNKGKAADIYPTPQNNSTVSLLTDSTPVTDTTALTPLYHSNTSNPPGPPKRTRWSKGADPVTSSLSEAHPPSSESSPFVDSNPGATSQTISETAIDLCDPPRRTGRDISVSDIVKHPKWIGNIQATKWDTLTPFVKQLVTDDGAPATFLVFGTISMSVCGRYGDFVPQFRDTLKKANLKWSLRVPTEQSTLFLQQIKQLNTITCTISPDFKDTSIGSQRPVKNDVEFELRCKLVRKRRPNTTIVAPADMDNERYWSRCSADGYEPNILPLGVHSYEGILQPFGNYEDVLQPGTTVVVTARMQAAFFNNKPYVQLVPLKFQVFGTEDMEQETIKDIF